MDPLAKLKGQRDRSPEVSGTKSDIFHRGPGRGALPEETRNGAQGGGPGWLVPRE